MKNITALCFMFAILSCTGPSTPGSQDTKKSIRNESYQPSWPSLRKHNTPQWLMDAKFGIYTHWGLTTTQLAHSGGVNKLSLREAIPYFRAEKFDAAEWAEMFQAAGARFAGPVAWHGHGFLNWDSDVTQWDVGEKGPMRDIKGELKKEIKKRGMKFMASYHMGYWYSMGKYEDPEEYTNPEWSGLYGPAHDLDAENVVAWKNHIEKQSKMNKEFQDFWLEVMTEAVDKYRPDLVWFDCTFGGTLRANNKGIYLNGKLTDPDENYMGGFRQDYQQAFLAHYFNSAEKWGKEVELVYKLHDIPPGIGMRDIENGVLDELAYDPWMTDIDLCNPVSWFYEEGTRFKSANYMIDLLADVVSKNGILLLNVPPRADGSFAEEAKQVLKKMGGWLAVNGEAIYGSMPWVVYGEGPSVYERTGHYSDAREGVAFGAEDIRYTVNGDRLYAICLDWPGEEMVSRALGSHGKLFEGEISAVELLGHEGILTWEQLPEKLVVEMPPEKPCDFAYVFRISLK